MQFNVVLTNHRPAALQALDDILRPLFFGLRAAGHGVVAGALQFRRRPAVNLVVENFSDPAFVRTVAEARAAWSRDLVLGVLCPFAVDGAGVDQARGAGLAAVMPLMDFAWTLAADQLPAGLIAAGRAAVVGYGFDEGLVGPRLISDPAGRDLDVVVYGQSGPRLDGLLARLLAAGRSHFAVRAGLLPDYIVADLLSRAKVVAAIDGEAGAEASLAPRALKAICNGAAVITEGGTVPDPLGAAVASCADTQIPVLCGRLIAEGRFVDRGLGALEQIRRTTTMREGVAAAAALAAAVSQLA